jgi:hypothetical protein
MPDKSFIKSGDTKKSDGTVVNIANLLVDLKTALDNVKINADSVNLNTNGLEALIGTSNTKLSEMLGADGSKRITTTDATTPDVGKVFIAIQVSEDAVFTTLTGNMANSAGLTLLAGTIVYGRFTAITLASGKVIAYMGV